MHDLTDDNPATQNRLPSTYNNHHLLWRYTHPTELHTIEMSESQEEMKIDPSRAQTLVSQLNSVKERLATVANGRNVCMHDTHTSNSRVPWLTHTSTRSDL